MADQDPKSELPKDVLAPQEEVRDDLVATAVKFLQNPKVSQSPLNQKKAFLQRKGLTLEEIELAIQRSGISQPTGQSSRSNAPAPDFSGQPPGVPSKQPDPVVSKWVKARDVLTVLTMVTGISYAAYRLYKRLRSTTDTDQWSLSKRPLEFLRPWLFGEPTVSKRLDQLEKLMTESVGNINTSLGTIEHDLKTQQEKLQLLSHDVNSKTGGLDTVTTLHNTQGLNDIKTELSSIKGLLLNRRQFPPMPLSSPVVPSWQLASNSGDANSNNKGREEEEEPVTGAQVTMTTSPLPDSSETSSSITMETSEDTTEVEQTVTPVSEETTMNEMKASEKQAADLENENDFKDNENDLENKVREPEVRVSDDDDDDDDDASSHVSVD